jgi:hypothetical protein
MPKPVNTISSNEVSHSHGHQLAVRNPPAVNNRPTNWNAFKVAFFFTMMSCLPLAVHAREERRAQLNQTEGFVRFVDMAVQNTIMEDPDQLARWTSFAIDMIVLAFALFAINRFADEIPNNNQEQ